MKKIIVKHIFYIFLFAFIIVLSWLFFVYKVYNNELKRTVYPILENSKQMLSEVVAKDFAKDKIKRFFKDFEKSREILAVSVVNKDKTVYYPEASRQNGSKFLSLLKLSYPIKNDREIVAWVDILPSYELFVKIITKDTTIIFLLVSVIAMLFVFIVISYLYIAKYVIYPFKQITMTINNMISNTKEDVDLPHGKSMWKNIFVDLKKFNAKVIDITTTMQLLFSATNIMTSDLELTQSIYLIFNTMRKKMDNTICALFVPSEDGQLKVIAKTGFSPHNIKSIPQNLSSPVWNCYKNCAEITVKDASSLKKEELGIFDNENIYSQINIPLMNESNDCMGVFSISYKDKDSFNSDDKDTIMLISKYLSLLMIRIRDYKKMKETNRKLEAEIQTTSKELISTNAMLIKKVRDIRAISDISSYASAKFDMENIIGYMIDKTKEILSVETAGVFIYSNTKDEFYSVEGSFSIYDIIRVGNDKGNIFYDVYKNKKSVIVRSRGSMQQYCPALADKINVNSAIFSPSKGENNIVAVVVAINKIGMDFTESDVRALEHIAVVVSSIIEKIKLYSKLKSETKK